MRLHHAASATALLTTLTLITSHASAQVADYGITFERVGEQTSDNTAPSSTRFQLGVTLASLQFGDFDSLELSGPNGTINTFEPAPGGFLFDFITGNFDNDADLFAAFPAGAYTLNTAGGTVGVLSEDVDISQAVLNGLGGFPAQPVFTGAVFSALQQQDASEAFTISWNSVPNGAGYFLEISEVASGPGVEIFGSSSFDGGPIVTSLEVPANTLAPGVSYEVRLGFASAVPDAVQTGFAGADNIAGPGILSQTSVRFSTRPLSAIPEPAAVAMLVLGSCVLATRRRRRNDPVC